MGLKAQLADSRSPVVAAAYDRAVFAKQLAATFRSNRRFRRAHPDFVTPPKSELRDATASTDFEGYRNSGLESAALFWELFREHVANRLTDRTEPLRVLEWGCGPARIIRHLPAMAAADGLTVEFHGSDFNPASIAWAQQNIAGVEFGLNDLQPPLPYAAAHFDFVYCWSVFTHLSEPMHRAWTAELHRVLRDGAPVAMSMQGPQLRSRLTAPEQQQFDRGDLVVIPRAAEGKLMYSAFHPHAYVRDLLAGFDVLAHHAPPHGQEIWVAAKRDSSAP